MFFSFFSFCSKDLKQNRRWSMNRSNEKEFFCYHCYFLQKCESHFFFFFFFNQDIRIIFIIISIHIKTFTRIIRVLHFFLIVETKRSNRSSLRVISLRPACLSWPVTRKDIQLMFSIPDGIEPDWNWRFEIFKESVFSTHSVEKFKGERAEFSSCYLKRHVCTAYHDH